MDKARKETDRILKRIERKVEAIYASDPALLRIQKEYVAYMAKVDKATKSAYLAYKNETNPNIRAELKNAYMGEIRALTLNSKEYLRIVSDFVRILADVNQQALQVVNDEMMEVYIDNYNQVAEECKEVGIEVNG